MIKVNVVFDCNKNKHSWLTNCVGLQIGLGISSATVLFKHQMASRFFVKKLNVFCAQQQASEVAKNRTAGLYQRMIKGVTNSDWQADSESDQFQLQYCVLNALCSVSP